MAKIKEILKLLLFLISLYKIEAKIRNKNKTTVSNYRPVYHVTPLKGWMNDPNGLIYFRGLYHVFYQHNPYSSKTPGIAHWGHSSSPDLVHWTHEPIAMYPDQRYDKDGVFSGSALVENDTLYIFYTGNVNLNNSNPSKRQVQALAYSNDGVNVTKYKNNPIIKGEEFQSDFRDPKVWKHGNYYYMVVGHSINGKYGSVLLFQSKNMIDWIFVSVLARSYGSLGYMWECPDFFELDGYHVILFSPQGIEPKGDKYKNEYQVVYIVGKFSYKTNQFKPMTKIRELDHGHDFYATQTILDEGRRLVLAWMDSWFKNYPESKTGFTGQMTFFRELKLTNELRLNQWPVKELEKIVDKELFYGKPCEGFKVLLLNKTGKIKIRATRERNFTVIIQDANNKTNRVIVHYNKRGYVTLNRGGEDGVRRTVYKPRDHLHIFILIDSSSIELFYGSCGEVTMSSRFFFKGSVIIQANDKAYECAVHSIKQSISSLV